jgi:CRISPR-associated endonuclease/helicase Cas3
MMVTFVSQCENKALNRTRRVLDAFANRIGDKTWQTVITNDGLNAVKKLLRKTASKNTAVSCYWLRSRSRSELIWIVGNRQKFNAQGFVPVNMTQQAIVNTQWENDWHYLSLIESLTALAALFHDFGKASMCFQEKLTPNSKHRFLGDPLRHEWVSTLLLNAFVNNETDEQWLARLAKGEIDEILLISGAAQNIKNPLAKLPMAASLIAWLVVSHHKLPLDYKDYKGYRFAKAETVVELLEYISQKWGYENNQDDQTFQKRLSQCLTFPNRLPSQSKPWLEQIMKWAAKMQDCIPSLNQAMKDGSWRLVLHHARLSLMLGDHHYSSKDADKKWHSDVTLIANTYREDSDGHKKGEAKQKLDEHLVGVSRSARSIVNLLPKFEEELPPARDIRSLKKKSPLAFSWQDKSVDNIKEWKKYLPKAQQDKPYGFFAVNMASTGCGKTYANAKIIRALSTDSDSLRFILALGLRTLTLQTGDEYRDRIGLDNSELAVLIGSRAVMELHKKNKNEQELQGLEQASKAAGSESLEALLDADEFIDYECAIPETKLNTILKQQRDRQFLYAPVLVCTIDYIIAATECKRGGRYILPSLRLMSSDLVIDEIDDFDGKDLIAIGRLIHLAGMLGRKVMISSATIPPDLAQGYLNAYREGWLLFAKTRDVSSNIGCAWIDEFGTQVETLSNCDTDEAINRYKNYHETFIEKRIKKLKAEPIKRKAEIISCHHIKDRKIESNADDKQTIESAYFDSIQQAIIEKHQQHGCSDPKTNKKISFGVVRVANIEPCVALTEYLAEANWPKDIDIRVMAYHSQQVLLLRSEQEKHLDQVLKRNEKQDEIPAAFKNAIIRGYLDNSQGNNIIFILVATPVEEVGRDHDFDWAVVEPSSFRSIIQLTGRVLRHRSNEPIKPNIALMQYNLMALKNTDNKPAYCKPGYERHDDDLNYMFNTHDLVKLIDIKFLEGGVNALPRIQRRNDLKPKENFADLEHYSISKLLTSYENCGPEAMQGWLTQCWWLTALPQQLNTFREGREQVKLFLVQQQEKFEFMEKDDNGCLHNVENSYGIRRQEMSETAFSKLWLFRSYEQLIEKCAEEQGITHLTATLKYGEILLPIYDDGMHNYQYSSQLGLSKLIK